MIRRWWWLWAALAVFGVLGYGVYRWLQPVPVQYETERVDRGSVSQVISTTGSLSALNTVQVGSQISGIIASIAVDFNDRVRAGQLLAQIDPSTYLAQEQQSLANLAAATANERQAVAQLEQLSATRQTLLADLASAKANLLKAKATAAEAARALSRAQDLFGRKLIAVADRDNAESQHDAASAAVLAAAAAIDAASARIAGNDAQQRSQAASIEAARAQVRQQEAQLAMVRINLDRTRIVSPIDGVVISRNVDVGQTVAASLQAPVMFSIANDLSQMQINTSVDEADIGRIRPGQIASFTVDAFPSQVFRGVVEQIRLAPAVNQNVVTYAVMINVDNRDLTLLPGMTANVSVHVDRRDRVLRIPNRALFFKPPDEVLAEHGRWSATDSMRVWRVVARGPSPRHWPGRKSGAGSGAPAAAADDRRDDPPGPAGADRNLSIGEDPEGIDDDAEAGSPQHRRRNPGQRDGASGLTGGPAGDPGDGLGRGRGSGSGSRAWRGGRPDLQGDRFAADGITQGAVTLEPVVVTTGLVDGARTEVLSGDLRPGDRLAVAVVARRNSSLLGAPGMRPPGMGRSGDPNREARRMSRGR